MGEKDIDVGKELEKYKEDSSYEYECRQLYKEYVTWEEGKNTQLTTTEMWNLFNGVCRFSDVSDLAYLSEPMNHRALIKSYPCYQLKTFIGTDDDSYPAESLKLYDEKCRVDSEN